MSTYSESRKHRAPAATIIGLMVLTQAAAAAAFDVKVTEAGDTVRWHDHVVTVALDDSLALLGPMGEVESAVTAALSTWQGSELLPAQLQISRSEGSQPGYRTDEENTNTIMALDGPWPYDPTWPAVTVTTYDADTGELLDADIVFDASRNWSTTEGAAFGTLDLQDVTTHEMGHFLGLEHSDVPEATMYPIVRPGSTVRRSLHVDDIHGLVAAYGFADEEPAPGSLQHGCSLAPREGVAGGLLPFALGLLGLSALVRARRRA